MGPHLISTTINEKPVYWKVNQEQLIGTEDIKEASLFYIIVTGNKFYPSSFKIAYWGDKKRDRRVVTDISTRVAKLRSIAPKLPAFLTTSAHFFGSSCGPLLFKYTFDVKTSLYTVHDRMYSSRGCFIRMAGPASIDTWIEGDEFYIKHSPHVLKNEYLALKLESAGDQTSFYASTSSSSTKGTTAQSPSYTSTTFPNIKDRDRKNVGMLFRLHPYQLQIMYDRVTPTEEVLLSLLPGGSY